MSAQERAAVVRRIAEHLGYCPHSTPEDERAGAEVLALLAEVARLEQERDAEHGTAKILSESLAATAKSLSTAEADLAAARAREQRLAQAMARIVANAEDWHGYLPDKSAPGAGHVRALAVIAEWGRAALAAEPAADELAPYDTGEGKTDVEFYGR